MSKPKNVGADIIVRFADGEQTEYKVHVDIPREDLQRLKNVVNHYVSLATNFPALAQMILSKLK